MNTVDFLRHVLPFAGPYCILNSWESADGKRGYKQHAAADIDEAVAISARLDRHGENVFFAIGALIKAREWDQKKQRWRVPRDGKNIRGVRSYVLDIDAGPDRQYGTVVDAIRALKQFVKAVDFPTPTIIASGNGLHVYWTLDTEVPEAQWEPYGRALKDLALAHQLRIDTKRTIDSSSVLRVVGTHNYKYDPAPEIESVVVSEPVNTEYFHSLLQGKSYAESILDAPPAEASVAAFGSNTNRYDNSLPDLSFPAAINHCRAFAHTANPDNQVQGRAAIPEPAWLAAVSLTTFMRKGRDAAHLISKDDPRYTYSHVEQKFDQIIDARKVRGIGPPTCKTFEEAYATAGVDICSGCPSRGKITSPAVISHYIERAAPLIVQDASGTREIPEPPKPFIRTKTGIAIATDSSKTGAPDIVQFCDYDMYPVKLRVDERTSQEDDVRWRIKLPRQDWQEVDIPHTPGNQVRTMLAKRGVYIDEPFIPHMTRFMSVYTRKLQNEIDREVAFAKLGWRKDNSFVLGTQLYKPDGTAEAHSITHALQTAIEDGVITAGDYDVWRQQVSLYRRVGLEPYRCTLYCSFGSILYGFTGQIATVVSATGVSGTGKSTLLDVCASVYGAPNKLVIRGDRNLSTRAAAEVRADAMHNLPVWMDETTGRDAKDIAELIFNYSGGKGKIRSSASGGIRADIATWSNILLANANTDDYERISTVYRDGTQHMMRLVQWRFTNNGAVTKGEGDALRNTIHEHYGHAGHVFIQYVVTHYDSVKRRVRDAVIEADRAVGAKSEERFWTATVAVARVAGEICEQLGILPNFPISDDVTWMYDQISTLRRQTSEQIPVAGEILSEYLDQQLPNTLTVGSKGAGNIDNILHQPRGELNVRVDVDVGLIWVNRAAFKEYCSERTINFNRCMDEMEKAGLVVRYSVMKTLGADTAYAKGPVRCIEIDLHKLGGKLAVVHSAPAAAVKAMGGKI